MKIFSRLFCKTVFAALLASYNLQGFEAKTLANDLGILNSQLEQLAHKIGCQTTAPFLSQLHLPEIICILDEEMNAAAPSRNDLEAFAKETCIEVVQLVVAWQDLSTQSFLRERPDPINKILADELGYKDQSIITCMKESAFNKTLNESIKQYKEMKKDFELSANVLQASIGGGFASCGYHTILHLRTLRDAIKNNKYEDLANLTNLFEVNKLFGLDLIVDGLNPILEKTQKTVLQSTWRNEIKQENERFTGYSNDKGEWLESPAMDTLATQHLEDGAGTASATFNDKPTKVGMIPIPAMSAQQIKINYDSISTSRKPKRYAFMVNIGNHWYGIFVTLNTTPALCIIVDSKNDPRYHERPVAEILKGLFPKSATEIGNAIDQRFSSKKINPARERKILRWEQLQSIAPLKNISEVTADIKKVNLKDFSDKELEYIFLSFVSLEPIRKYFKGASKSFIADFKSKKQSLEDYISELLAIIASKSL